MFPIFLLLISPLDLRREQHMIRLRLLSRGGDKWRCEAHLPVGETNPPCSCCLWLPPQGLLRIGMADSSLTSSGGTRGFIGRYRLQPQVCSTEGHATAAQI